MANLAFPQLSTGALVQYPFRKRRTIQSSVNAFADGSMIASNINANYQHVWELAYSELTSTEMNALQAHFAACQGPFLPFIFIDPTANMLGYSSNLTIGSWQRDPLLSVTPGAADPLGGNSAFTLVNSGQIDQKVSQQISAPANFQYCFSIFAFASTPTSLSLGSNAVSSQSQQFAVGANWSRLINPSRLSDELMSFTVSVTVPASQTVVVFGPQLEPQLRPSRYRATAVAGGVYPNAHFLGDSISFESDAPGLFSTLISIETT